MIILKTAEEIAVLREAGRIVARCLEILAEAIRPGITTGELDAIAEAFIRKSGGIPTFKGYFGYPASICTSPNDVVVHGIPGPRVLKDGDIVSIDVGVTYKGFVGDAAYTWPVGRVSEAARKLLRVTEEALHAGIAQARPGNRLGDISHAVQAHVEAHGFSVVRDYVGHGVGRRMHEEPQVPNFGPPGKGPVLAAGMVLAIEPMVNAGGHEVFTDRDNWTVRTRDGKLSAHFEHSVAITEDGPEILTLR